MDHGGDLDAAFHVTVAKSHLSNLCHGAVKALSHAHPSTRMEVLAKATGVTVNNSHFTNIGGNQVNYYTTTRHARGRREIKESLPRLEEFNEVKQGNIIKDKDIGDPWPLCSREQTAETAVYTAKIVPFGNELFTVKAYSGGRKAKKKWRRDFLKCSNDWRRDIPLFGYSKSSVPLLIFHGGTWPVEEEFWLFYNVIFSELVPVAHVEKELGVVGRLYFEFLRMSLKCSRNELWMDPTKGRFCRGPAGPKSSDWVGNFNDVIVPSDVEFLKEDIIIRYLSSTKDDRGLFWALNYSRHSVLTEEIPSAYCSQIISSLTNSTIALHRNIYWWSWKGCIEQGEEMPEGMTRFRLKDDKRSIDVKSVRETTSWLSQALSIFHTHDIRLDEDLGIYQLVSPRFTLTGTLQRSRCKRQRRQLYGPIYLFLLPSPSPVRHFYFWSHDPIGHIPLSRDRCKHLGLPFKLSIKVKHFRESWPTEVYKTIREYQLAGGFDPITTDFARFRRFPFFEVVPPESRFQEVEKAEDIQIKGSTNTSISPASAVDSVQSTRPTSTQPVGTMRALLGALISPFTSEAVENLGISTVAI
ncbi:hypothetical protein L218DRAFT_988262 [Marasmius fiardii PR-910]|nr:hypothetical protein L218DRAFT_988262 [Marasmius fiardii PR-910]